MILTQLLKFALTGITNTLIDFTVFNLLLSLTHISSGPGLLLINLLAVAAAAVNSFYMNRGFTFRATAHRAQAPQFIIATLTGMALNSLGVMVFSALTPIIPFPHTVTLNLGKGAGAILSSVWNFIAYRNWVFSRSVPGSDRELAVVVPGLTSVIIPAFNESHRLPGRLRELASYLPPQFPVEILVVDDGSTDDTADLARSFAEDHPCITCHSYHSNQGKGMAVRTGMLKARGQYLIFTDADDSFSPQQIELVARQLHRGSPVVIACRPVLAGERTQGESRLRCIMGKTFNRIVQVLLLPGLNDTQCGLKGFENSAARQIFSRQRVKGFAFDVEILSLARAMKYDIHQQPVAIADCSGSRVNQLLDPLCMLRDIIRIKWFMTFNSYGLNRPGPSLAPLALGAGLFSTALALRLPWLWQFPRFIDELNEVNLAYQIYLGHTLPLHNAAHDIGAMHNYLLAGLFRLLGPGIYWPRLYVACLSALGVVLVYKLGKRLYGHYAGLLAAVFLLFNGMHILNSHMAWANCTTPTFFTAALLALVNAEKEHNGKYLLLSGILWAAALQTHASVIIYIAVIFIYVLTPGFRQRSGIALKWRLYSLTAFLLGYFNMLYYNLVSRGGSFRWLSTKDYALEQHHNVSSYLLNLEQMAAELLRTLSSCYGQHTHLWQYLNEPFFLLALLLLVYGGYLSYRHHDIHSLPFWFLLADLVVMPIINHRYVFYLATRYIMPVVICSLLMMTLALRQLGQAIFIVQPKKAVSVALVTGLLFLSALQYVPYTRYCLSQLDSNASNRLALEVWAAATRMASEHDSMVLIDESLPLENHPLPCLLALTSQPYRETAISPDTPVNGGGFVSDLSPARNHLIAIVSDQSYRRIARYITPNHKTCFTSRVVLPTAAKEPRNIYVLVWDK